MGDEVGIWRERWLVFVAVCLCGVQYLERELRISGLPFPFELEVRKVT